MRRASLCLIGVLAVALVIGLWTVSFGAGGKAGEGGKGGDGGGARYTVVHTEGFNLIVTDNRSNTVYFYTIDKDGEVGDDLKLRGSLDLNDVGKKELKPKIFSKK